jgi:hypothetical protein
MTLQTAIRKPRPVIRRPRPQQRPAVSCRGLASPRSLAEEMLRELAFVFHVTQSVKRAMMKRPSPCCATGAR